MVGCFDLRCGLLDPMGTNQSPLPWEAYLTLSKMIMTNYKLLEVLI